MNGNIWSSILRDSSKRTRLEDSACIILGGVNCGKSRLVSKLCAGRSKGEDTNGYLNKEIISYDFFTIEEGISESELVSKVNVWSISDRSFDGAVETVTKSCKSIDQELFVICLDLVNEQDCVNSLISWLQILCGFIEQQEQTEKDRDKAEKRRLALQSYVQSVRNNKGLGVPAEEEKEEENSTGSVGISVNLGVPILVVGCKADAVRLETIASMNRARELQGTLRALCLQFGAALVYTSAERGTNVDRLKQYIIHRLYPKESKFELRLEDSAEACFVPSGFDTAELISVSCGLSRESFPVLHRNPTAAVGAVQNSAEVEPSLSEETKDLESEEEWLSGLQQFLKQVSADASTQPGSASLAHTSSAQSLKTPTVGPGPGGSVPVAGDAKHLRRATTSAALVPQHAGDSTNGVTASGAAAAAAVNTTSVPEKPSAPATRRATAVATGKKPAASQDVNSFFQDLLKK